MNSLTNLDTSYLRPSRTIETILLENDSNRQIVYVYNHDGIYYHVFEFVIDLMAYFNNEKESEICFESESELDEYLLRLDLKSMSCGSSILV